jgi:phage terminase large subunit-like protein
MFDTIDGLPVHALVIHAVVVILPLMAVLTIVVAVRRGLRERYSWWVLAGNVVVAGLTLVAKQSGEALRASLGGQIAKEHAALGTLLPWFALFLVLTSVGMALTRRNRALGPVAVVLTIVAAVAAVVWTVRTGDAGTRAVWGSRGA